MKIKLDRDEWWPVWSVGDYGIECDVPKKTLEKWLIINAQFSEMQEEMKAFVRKSDRRQESTTSNPDPTHP